MTRAAQLLLQCEEAPKNTKRKLLTYGAVAAAGLGGAAALAHKYPHIGHHLKEIGKGFIGTDDDEKESPSATPVASVKHPEPEPSKWDKGKEVVAQYAQDHPNHTAFFKQQAFARGGKFLGNFTK